ncbi:phospholipase D-like domain-containing protein [Methylococcus sp. EFPC2]|uniref:phospholipase D-like domain-containing protein n=1 Tax=Methylococcus sp. EFPC2 TaxID=2812648 RepID=UPI001968794A|nr:phospholipase D-like domain-containing protein [Methylococcus sp. EFPC2]QSA98826.1 hypothetical protein JWZ97_08630 [Methylococcus sp. EFPC2]
MSTVTGRVIDEFGTPLPNLTVEALGDWLLTQEQLNAKDAKSDEQGRFTLEVPDLVGIPDQPLVSFRFRVVDDVRRPLIKDRELAGTIAIHALGDIQIRRADKEGLLVTQLTGKAEMVSSGNNMELLVDGSEAFGRIADDIRSATRSINMTQLFFALPEPKRNSSEEPPQLIFKFLRWLDTPEGAWHDPPIIPHDPNLTGNQPPAVPRGETLLSSDARPERLLVDAARSGKTVRILLNEPGLSWPEGIFWLAVLTPLAAGLGVGGVNLLAACMGVGFAIFPIALALTVVAYFVEFVVVKIKLQNNTDVDEARHYFGIATEYVEATTHPIAVRGFRQAAPDNGVLHCKMVITDEQRAVVVGSPFTQRYFDYYGHRIDDPHRGANTDDMVHDLSVAVTGPAVRDLYDTFRLFWNEDLPELEKIPEMPPLTAQAGNGPKVQVIRTLSGQRFAKLGGTSEKGILEAYLRAFASARHYIYLETQYFTDSVITDGLVEVLKKKPNLELILVVPIKPDVPFYPRRQALRIAQLRAAGGDRVGVFTRWSYDGNRPNNARPWVAPVYIHAKGAVVDDAWATVGSANLDGLSLDYNLLLSPLVFGETTAAELNLSVVPEVAGATTPFAETMRRRLFAEHLGLIDAHGKPDPNHTDLAHGTNYNWVRDLWRPKAVEALAHIKAARREPLPGFVLEYPQEDGGSLDTPRKHLAALGIRLEINDAVVRPISGTRGFDFSTGSWRKSPEHEDFRR